MRDGDRLTLSEAEQEELDTLVRRTLRLSGREILEFEFFSIRRVANHNNRIWVDVNGATIFITDTKGFNLNPYYGYRAIRIIERLRRHLVLEDLSRV
jgi:hypothetical protein